MRMLDDSYTVVMPEEKHASLPFCCTKNSGQCTNESRRRPEYQSRSFTFTRKKNPQNKQTYKYYSGLKCQPVSPPQGMHHGGGNDKNRPITPAICRLYTRNKHYSITQ